MQGELENIKLQFMSNAMICVDQNFAFWCILSDLSDQTDLDILLEQNENSTSFE